MTGPMAGSAKGSWASDWWARLDREDRAARAQLRRCQTPLEALLVPATFRLMPAAARADDRRAPYYGVVAATLAHVREDDPDRKPVARAIGRATINDDEALLSELRFRRLLEADTPEELMTGMRRLVRIAGGRVHVDDLARSILNWGDAVKRRWAFDYYAAGIARPEPEKSETQDERGGKNANG